MLQIFFFCYNISVFKIETQFYVNAIFKKQFMQFMTYVKILIHKKRRNRNNMNIFLQVDNCSVFYFYMQRWNMVYVKDITNLAPFNLHNVSVLSN